MKVLLVKRLMPCDHAYKWYLLRVRGNERRKKIVRGCDSSASGICQNPLLASSLLNPISVFPI